MSRTDKDVPWWVAAEFWEPDHYRCEYDIMRRRWQHGRNDRECDLPSEPVVQNPKLPKGRRYLTRSCQWEPVWSHDYRGYHYYASPPPQDYIDHVWNGPERRRIRDDALQAIKEYRATGEVDVMTPGNQHRHCATWLWS